jgi:hypothetical protein
MRKTSTKADIECEQGSGNVFADLGLTDAEEWLSRAKLGYRPDCCKNIL